MSLERSDALARFPELKDAYTALDELKRQFAWRSELAQDSILTSAKATLAKRMRDGQLPIT